MTTHSKTVVIAWALVLLGNAVLVAVPYNDGHGKLWREPAEVMGYSWNQVQGLCPTDGITGCGGTLEGWTWATQQQTFDLFNQFLPPTHQLSVDTPGIDAFANNPFRYTTVFAMNGAPYSFFSATRGWTSTLDSQGLGIRGTISQGGGSVSFYASIGVNDPFSVSQTPGYLNETGIWLWQDSPRVSGDVNNDGDVDGRDFLVWQRGGSPNPMSSNDLAAWQANYGVESLMAASVAVPEPYSFVLGAAFITLCFAQRRRFC